MPRLVIDDREVEVPNGSKVIEAAERLGIVIPRFCYHEAMGSIGACRMCAVKFLQGPFKGVQMSCMIDAQDGMVVSTTDEEAVQFRKRVIELLMKNHPLDCPVCDEGGQCLLQDETWSSGHAIRRFRGNKRTYRDQYLGPYIQHEMNRCIHCYRCSRFYQEFAGYRDLGPMQIAEHVYFGRFTEGKLESPFSGNLVDICPTGVYTDKTARFKVRRWDLRRAPSICNQCSLGCNTIGNAHYRGVMRVEARYSAEVNGYFMCDAGRFGFSYTNGGTDHKDRPWRPRVDGGSVTGPGALAKAAEALGGISEKFGPGAIAVVGSNRNSLETQCMLSRVCRTKNWRGPALYFDPSRFRGTRTAVECLDKEIAASMREIEKADFVIVAGADPLNEAGMAALAIRQASRKNAPVVVIDPRPVSLPFHFEHVPAAPGEIERYVAAMLSKAVEKDSANFDKDAAGFYKSLAAGTEDLELPVAFSSLCEHLGVSQRPVIVCGTGVTRETTPGFACDCARLFRAARKDARLFYILPGASAFSSALLSGAEGLGFAQVLNEVEKGAVRALVLVESDPFHYYPDRKRLDHAMSKLDLVIAIDYFETETVKRAGIFYPSSTIFEIGSSYINQEGRVQFAHQVHAGGVPIWGGGYPPRVYQEFAPGGEHLPAWQVIAEIAGEQAAETSMAGIVAAEHTAFEVLADGNYRENATRILPDKSGRENGWTAWSPPPGARSESPHGLELLMVEWMFGTSEFSAHSDSLQGGVTEPTMSMHPKDAERAGVSDGDLVSVELDNGAMEIAVSVSNRTAEGVLVVPRHQSVDWRKMKDFTVRVLPEKIRKVNNGA
jgi:NADH-quinone oxidoreductase subunit G